MKTHCASTCWLINQTHKDLFHFLHFQGKFYPHKALFRLRYVSSLESSCWDVFFFLLDGKFNYQTCLLWLNWFDYKMHMLKPCFIRYTEYTENINEASCTGCSSKFLIIFHLFIYLAEMNRVEISLTNNTLLQTAWNQLCDCCSPLSEGNCLNARWNWEEVRVDHTVPQSCGSWMDE